MSEPGSDCVDGCGSPIFGFSSGSGADEDEKEEPRSFCAEDPDLKIESEELGECENASPSTPKSEELMPPPRTRGFSTASGKIIPVSEEALQIAKKKMELMDGWVDAFDNDGPSTFQNDPSRVNENTFQKSVTVPQVKGLFNANVKTFSVPRKPLQAVKTMNLDVFRKGKMQVNKPAQVSCVSTTYVFDKGTQSRLSAEESNEVEDCTRLLLEDMSADDETEWDDVSTQLEARPISPVAESDKENRNPAFVVRKAQTSTKRLNTEPLDLPNSSNSAKRVRFTKKFVPPRRQDP